MAGKKPDNSDEGEPGRDDDRASLSSTDLVAADVRSDDAPSTGGEAPPASATRPARGAVGPPPALRMPAPGRSASPVPEQLNLGEPPPAPEELPPPTPPPPPPQQQQQRPQPPSLANEKRSTGSMSGAESSRIDAHPADEGMRRADRHHDLTKVASSLRGRFAPWVFIIGLLIALGFASCSMDTIQTIALSVGTLDGHGDMMISLLVSNGLVTFGMLALGYALIRLAERLIRPLWMDLERGDPNRGVPPFLATDDLSIAQLIKDVLSALLDRIRPK